MPQITNRLMTITRNGSVSATIPRFTIAVDLINPVSGAVVQSYNTNFPAFLTQFTNEEQEQLLKELIDAAIRIKQNQLP